MSLPSLGAILVGGRSTRMGQDKAHVVVRGATMLEHARRTVAAVCTDVVTVGGDGCDIVDDRSGPLGAVLSVLRSARAAVAGRVVVVAVDQPLLTPAALAVLLAHDAGPEDIVAFEGEPFPLVAGAGALPRVAALLDAGQQRVGAAVSVWVPLQDVHRRALQNVNRPEDVVAVDDQ